MTLHALRLLLLQVLLSDHGTAGGALFGPRLLHPPPKRRLTPVATLLPRLLATLAPVVGLRAAQEAAGLLALGAFQAGHVAILATLSSIRSLILPHLQHSRSFSSSFDGL